MILPNWVLTGIITVIGALIAFSVRQALARMREYHLVAMGRLDKLTTCIEGVRTDLGAHMRDHATGEFNNRRRLD